jgi:cytochrome P450
MLVAEDWPLGVCMLLGYKSVAVLTFDDHLNMRKLMSPAFNPKHLARGIPRLVELAEEHCREWAQKGDVMGAKAIKAFTFHVSTHFL